MARETAPRADRAKGGVQNGVRTVYMTKFEPTYDNAQLDRYEELGYAVTEEARRYKLTCRQEDFLRREREYQQRGIAQAERVSRQRDSEGLDNASEQTITTVTRVPMSVDAILGGDSVASAL